MALKPLTEQDEAVLAFEAKWERHSGAKEAAIRGAFGVSAARYYQMLYRAIDKPAALVSNPLLVKRCQRRRADRVAARASRRYSNG